MSVSNVVSKLPRKSNFSPAECTLLLEMAEQNVRVIWEKFSNSLNNKMKADLWKSITDKVTAIGVAKKTTGEIKDKWRTMVSSAKKDFSRVK